MARLGVWPPLPIGVYRRPPADRLPYPLEEESCRLVSLARQGLYQAVSALGLESEDEILVPAYHHGAEVEALRQAGPTLRFYPMNDDLSPSERHLDALTGPRVRALYLTHVLGLVQDAAYWRSWCDDHGLLLIEDAAQAFLASWHGVPVGSDADISIFCLYKTFGLPDGAAVVATPPPDFASSVSSLGVRRLVRKHVAAIAAQVPVPSMLYHRFRTLHMNLADPHAEFEIGDPEAPPSRATLRLLTRVIDKAAAQRRFANYRYLLEALGEYVPRPFAEPREGSVPYAFPIRSSDPSAFAAHLARRGVSSAFFWKNPHPLLKVDRFPLERDLRATTVVVPVHQELRSRDLDRIVRAVRSET